MANIILSLKVSGKKILSLKMSGQYDISIYITHCTHLTLLCIYTTVNAVHIHVHIFCIFVKRTDTVRTVSSGKTETDQSNVYALEANAHVIISTTLGTVF